MTPNTWTCACGGGECVEIQWMRACSDGMCVEVGHADGEYLVRDSKLADAGPVLRFTAEEWKQFTDGVKRGVFD